MQNILIVVDMQNDFIDGALGTAEAVAIVPAVLDKIKNFEGKIIFTRDTHHENYMQTQEGENLPVPHCIENSFGWQIREGLQGHGEIAVLDKPTFGSRELGEMMVKLNGEEEISSVCLIGLCTDICVISNALLVKAFLPEVPVSVDAACCAGVSPQSHLNALAAMKMCQIKIENE